MPQWVPSCQGTSCCTLIKSSQQLVALWLTVRTPATDTQHRRTSGVVLIVFLAVGRTAHNECAVLMLAIADRRVAAILHLSETVPDSAGLICIRIPERRGQTPANAVDSRATCNLTTSQKATTQEIPTFLTTFQLRHDQVMRANVGTGAEWSSAAPSLDSFVACASSLFERFSSTGKMPDHPLLSGNTNNANDEPSSAQPSSGTRHGNGDAGGGEGRADPRESPGSRSPGVRSPGFPPYWLGPGSAEGEEGGGGGRRRMSTPVGQGTSRGKNGGSGSGGGQGTVRGKKSTPSAHRPARGGGTVGTTLIASPPRARSRSAMVGGVHGAGGGLARKPRRRTSKSKAGAGDGDLAASS